MAPLIDTLTPRISHLRYAKYDSSYPYIIAYYFH